MLRHEVPHLLGLAYVMQPRTLHAGPRLRHAASPSSCRASLRHAEPSLRHAASPASHSLACVVPGYDRVCVTLR